MRLPRTAMSFSVCIRPSSRQRALRSAGQKIRQLCAVEGDIHGVGVLLLREMPEIYEQLAAQTFLAEQRGLQLQKIVVRGENAHQIFHNGQLVGTLTAVRGENAVDVQLYHGDLVQRQNLHLRGKSVQQPDVFTVAVSRIENVHRAFPAAGVRMDQLDRAGENDEQPRRALLRLNDDLPRRGAAHLGLKAVQHRTDLLRRQAVKKGRGLQKFFLLFAECAEHESILLI